MLGNLKFKVSYDNYILCNHWQDKHGKQWQLFLMYYYIILLPSGTQYMFSDVLHMKVTVTEVRILCEWCLICSTDHFQPLYQKF